jgi:hypothetical protein
MDQAGQTSLFVAQIASGIRTPNEARELLNLPPLTPAQLAEIASLKSSMGGPPQPIQNPGAKGLSKQKRKQRDYMPIGPDAGGPYDTGNGTFTLAQSHCSECCDSRALQGATEIQMSQMPEGWHVMAADACTCPAGCSCNPVGSGCTYPPGECACGCAEDQEAATPTYTPNNPNEPKYDGTFQFPGRSQDSVLHLYLES